MFPLGRAMMTALLAASVKLKASPIACPDRVRELIHSEFVTVAVPLRLKLASCARVIEIFGATGKDFFTTWKYAEPDIPILRQAKAEYQKLTATASTAVSASREKQ